MKSLTKKSLRLGLSRTIPIKCHKLIMTYSNMNFMKMEVINDFLIIFKSLSRGFGGWGGVWGGVSSLGVWVGCLGALLGVGGGCLGVAVGVSLGVLGGCLGTELVVRGGCLGVMLGCFDGCLGLTIGCQGWVFGSGAWVFRQVS